MKNNYLTFRIIFWITVLSLLFLLTGCANLPTRYGDWIIVKKGIYQGKNGVLVGDCSGFENYRVKLFPNKFVCIRSWNMEKVR